MKIATSILTVLTLGFYAFQPALAGEKDHDDHDHGKIVAGPNGGRVITEVEPHLEFLVNKDRTVKITALDDHNKPAKIGDQSVSIIAGERSKPTKLAFTVKDGVLVSDVALPAGNDFPVVLQIKPGKKGKIVTAKFNVNLNDCPTCKNKEYACTCEHGDDEKK
ncbi:MAG: hypothetical protein KDN22_13885 [Verrucomicrobiae bacterium]|nr:hypothetical protein [Verrucomicrobiae bacterium]